MSPQYSTMSMNSKKGSMNSQKIDESMRGLVMNYIHAQNKGDHATAEVILHEINTLRKLCDENA